MNQDKNSSPSPSPEEIYEQLYYGHLSPLDSHPARVCIPETWRKYPQFRLQHEDCCQKFGVSVGTQFNL